MFRPIAVIPVIDNVFERILHNKAFNYLVNIKLLNEYQYGFRKGCGTGEDVVNIINFTCNGLDQGHKGVAGIFFDFTKAFAIVDQLYKICGNELKLLKSYLKNKKQFVQKQCRHLKFITGPFAVMASKCQAY